MWSSSTRKIYLYGVLILIHTGNLNPVDGNDALRPVWQWINPTEPNIDWPASRPEGEVKACACAYVDSKKYCIDSVAKGLKASFPCGVDNYRNRAGNDEKAIGMRQEQIECYCSFNQGLQLLHNHVLKREKHMPWKQMMRENELFQFRFCPTFSFFRQHLAFTYTLRKCLRQDS